MSPVGVSGELVNDDEGRGCATNNNHDEVERKKEKEERSLLILPGMSTTFAPNTWPEMYIE